MDLTKTPRQISYLGMLVLLTWLSQVFYLVRDWPPAEMVAVRQEFAEAIAENLQTVQPTERQAAVKQYTDRIEATLWSGWNFRLGIILIGITASLLALLRVRFWRLAVIATSLFYLVAWYSNSVTSALSPLQAFRLRLMTAERLGTIPIFIHQDLLLPLIYLLLALYCTLAPIKTSKQTCEKNKTI